MIGRVNIDKNDDNICRYCLEKVRENDENVHRPCDCRSYVHDACLNRWVNSQGAHNTQSCEICKSEFSIASVTVKKCDCTLFEKHLITFWNCVYIILGFLSIPFTLSIVIFSGSLFHNIDSVLIPMANITAGVTIILWGAAYIYAIERHTISTYTKISTVYLLICLGCMITQGLSCVIANPILGRPIAFTPRGETFGIMLAIFIALALVVLAIWGTVVYIKRTCIATSTVHTYVDKEHKEHVLKKEIV